MRECALISQTAVGPFSLKDLELKADSLLCEDLEAESIFFFTVDQPQRGKTEGVCT